MQLERVSNYFCPLIFPRVLPRTPKTFAHKLQSGDGNVVIVKSCEKLLEAILIRRYMKYFRGIKHSTRFLNEQFPKGFSTPN